MHPYAPQYPLPPSGHSQIQQAAEATMRRGSEGSGIFSQGNGPAPGGGPPSTPQQLAQRSLDVNQGSDPNNADSSRKRSKVSRACDECRRKKIRCDAESEVPGTTCTACRRSGQHCDFSRAPQKRGPSKGYIKELAERVNYLEYKTGGPPAEVQYSPIVHEQPGPYPPAPPPTDFAGRKRGYESFQEPSSFDNTYSSLQEFNARQQRPASGAQGGEDQLLGALQPTEGGQPQSRNMNATVEHEKWIKSYYELIHPVLPILSHTIADMQRDVQNVPAGLCEAFFAALEAAVTACTAVQTEPSISQAAKQLLLVQADPQLTPTMLSHLVSLQALILMIIATINCYPSINDSNRWFGLAIATATNAKLQLHRPQDARYTNDPFSCATQGRRAWLILFILDRWHAAATVIPPVVQDASAKLLDPDFALLGAPTYHMFRLSRILGHLTECFIHNNSDLAVPPSKGGKLNIVLDGEIETFRESVKDHFQTMPHLNLAYYYLRLLADRNLEVHFSKINSVINAALHIVTLLNHKRGIYASPLLHYITSLTALTLAKAFDHSVNPNTVIALQDFRAGLDNTAYRNNSDKPAWDAAVSGFITKKLDSGPQGFGHDGDRGPLEHLANAAVGKSGPSNGVGEGGQRRAEGESIDWSVETAKGYLNLFE